MNWLLVAILGYVLVQFAIGTWVSRRVSNETDYILAGRGLGVGLVTFSVFATYFGAEAIVASGGSVYEKGLSGALVDPVGYASAIVIVGLFFARALWSRGLTTFADLFRQRYSQGVERLVVIVLLPGSVIWAAAQVRAFGQVLSANSEMSLAVTITLAAILVGAYSVVGGLLADAVTDVIQGVAVVLGLLILGAVVAVHVGGMSGGLAQVEAEQLKLADGGWLQTLEQLAIPICGTIVAVELISRFLGARTADVARIGTVLGGSIYFFVGLIPVFLGLVGPRIAGNVPEAEQIVPRLAELYLPGVLYVAFVGAIISAILSAVHAALHAVVRAHDGDGAEHRSLRAGDHLAADQGPGRDGIGVRQCRRLRHLAVCAVHSFRRTCQRLRVGGSRHARLGRRQVRPRPPRTLCHGPPGGPGRLCGHGDFRAPPPLNRRQRSGRGRLDVRRMAAPRPLHCSCWIYSRVDTAAQLPRQA